MKLKSPLLPLLLALMAAAALPAAATPPPFALESVFREPPHEARPSTWWHWMNGNVTEPGIVKDLEAMKASGLGGVYLFNANFEYPEGPARFLTEPWLQKMDRVFETSERLGLDFGVHNCDGFSQSGGPWITPETSMKIFTWRTIDVEGGQEFSGLIPVPAHKLDFYRDVAVVAYPLPTGGRFNGPGSGVKLTGPAPAAELAKLADGNLATTAEAGAAVFTFAELRTLRSVVLRGDFVGKDFSGGAVEKFPVSVEASDDGKEFRPTGAGTLGWSGPTVTIATDETTARCFRVTAPGRVAEIELTDAALVHFAESKSTQSQRIGHGVELRLHQAYPGPDPLRPLPAASIIAPGSVVNLTARMDAAGRLAWTVPPGRWRVLRFGYTSTGERVSPATREGSGLECDKLDPAVVRHHLDSYVGKLVTRAGARAGQVFDVMETDSWESGIQNWTAGLEQRFARATGYDLLAWLPALAEGRIIGDADRTERFLWDWRRFLADQFSANYFQTVQQWAHDHGLSYYSEPTGLQQFHYDVANQRFNDRPMGEFWVAAQGGVRIDNKIASSLAHVTGRAIVTAEAFTGQVNYAFHPAMLKRLGDEALCLGVNHLTFHTYAHQPHETFGPAFTFGPWGLHFNRANTWWRTGRAWIDYYARTCALLQQGRAVGDVLYYVGEDVPNRVGWREELRPALPAGHDYDGADVTAVMEARVADGRIVLPSGQNYRVLLLPTLAWMRPAVLEHIAALVRDGATVVGPRPLRSPSLRDIGEGDGVIVRLGDELWGAQSVPGVEVDRTVGRGRVFDGLDFPEIFRRLGVAADFGHSGTPADTKLLYAHRRTDEADLYFVSNQGEAPVSAEVSFRVGAKQPELWSPDDGRITRPAVARASGDVLTMPLRLDGAGSVFVVFRDPLPADSLVSVAGEAPSNDLSACAFERATAGQLVARLAGAGVHHAQRADGREFSVSAAVPAPLPLGGPWTVQFADVPASPGALTFDRLVSWSEHPDERVRFFSGTAVYEKNFDVSADRLGADRELFLDLGDVQVHAEVEVNGRPVTILWKAPYRVRIDPFVQPGANRLVVRVVNLWPNRLIGDAGLPDEIERTHLGFPKAFPAWLVAGLQRPGPRVAFATIQKGSRVAASNFQPGDPLLPSGLHGPVTLRSVVIRPLGEP